MRLRALTGLEREKLENEHAELLRKIAEYKAILADEKLLLGVIKKEITETADKYGDDRRTSIEEKEDSQPIDKRALIAEEEVMIAVTRDGYLKRSSIKSYKSSDSQFPGMKDGDAIVAMNTGLTTDYLICFTNLGNYITVPVHNMTENRWKDEGKHINDFATLGAGEKIFKAIVVHELRDDIFLAILTKFGQIKRMPLSALDLLKRSRPARFMKLLNNDEIVGVEVCNGDSDLLVLTSNGNASLFNENDLSVTSSKAGGVKSIQGLGRNTAVALLAFSEGETTKICLITDKWHYRIADDSRFPKTQRLGKVNNILPCFKGDVHTLVGACKIDKKDEENKVILYLTDKSIVEYVLPDIYLTDASKHAGRNMSIDGVDKKINIDAILYSSIEKVDAKLVSHYVPAEDDYVEEETNNSDSNETNDEVVENTTETSENNVESAKNDIEVAVEAEVNSEETNNNEPSIESNEEEKVEETVVVEKEATPEEAAPKEEAKEEEAVESVEVESLFQDFDDDNPFSDYMSYKAKKAAKARENRANKKKKENSGFEQISIFEDLD